MPTIELPYGTRMLSVDVPEKNLMGVVHEKPVSVRPLRELFDEAWSNPYGMDDPASVCGSGESVAIVISDHTRPTPTRALLPLLWQRLRGTVRAEDVTILVATGTHRGTTEGELRALLGEMRGTFRVAVHDCHKDCVEVGRSSRGNVIELNRYAAEADHVLSIGTIGMHYYAGYSGGRKNIFPGVGSAASVERNHAMMEHSESRPCTYEGNPVSEELVEASRCVAYRFIVDVVLRGDGQVAGVFVGEPEAAHKAGRDFWDEHFPVEVSERADLVLASVGGHPKDINFYQAHKGQYNASLATADGGMSYLSAACPKGWGHNVFEEWMRRAETLEDVHRIYQEEGFRLGGHKAVYFAKDRQRIDILLQSELPDDDVRSFFMTPVQSPQEALEIARSRFGDDLRVLVMPHAAATYPLLPRD